MAKENNRGLLLQRDGYKSVPGEHYGTPKEIWNFRTRAQHGSPASIARNFLACNSELFQLAPGLGGLEVQRTIRSLGATHVILRQSHDGRRVHRGYVSVHMDLSGRVFLAKNRSMPARLLPDGFELRLDREQAIKRARHLLHRRGRLAVHVPPEPLWYPRDDKLIPAWKIRLMHENPREEWIIYINARTGARLHAHDNLSNAPVGRGMIFDPNPVTALGDHATLLTRKKRPRRPPAAAYRDVELLGLDGSGYLSGKNVTTAPTPIKRIRRKDLQFMLSSHEHGFEEVMAYFHIDTALRYLETLGYRGAKSIFHEPVKVKVNGTRQDNSWYSPVERALTFGTGAIDDAEDAETILHELGHAIQDAICPDFGQSAEAGAMGEGFGDYFAASFFESRKPARYRHSVMSWDGLMIGLQSKSDPPSLRRVDSTLTWRNFDNDGDVHDNGVIWSATLWDIRNLLGRETADRIILESHFQLDGFTTFAKGARAIIDADRNLLRGRHGAALTRIFQRRKIGPL